MANIKQQIKRNKKNDKNKLKNASFKSSVKTSLKKVETSIETGNKEAAVLSYNLACKKLDKALTKGIFHKNYVARNKSRLSLLVNTIK